MDGVETGTVAGGHVLVESLNSLSAAHLTELLVHVVAGIELASWSGRADAGVLYSRSGARVVAEPDTEVLDLEWVLLVDLYSQSIFQSPFLAFHEIGSTHLVQADDLTVGLLDLAELGKEVPESALGNDIVWSKDAHAVELWGRVGITWKVTANDLVFLESARHFCGRPDGNQNQQPSYKMYCASERCMYPLPYS